MELLGFALGAIIFFVIGFSFLLGGYFSSPSRKEFIPRSEFELKQKAFMASEKSLKEVQSVQENTKKELDALKQELASAHQQVEVIQGELKTKEEAFRQAQDTTRQTEEKMAAKSAEDKKQIQDLKDHNDHLQLQLSKFPLTIKDLQNRIDSLVRKVNEQAQGSVQIIEGLEEQIKGFQQREAQEQNRLKELEQQLLTLNANSQALEDVQTQNDLLRKEHEHLQEQHAQAQQELKNLKERMILVTQENQGLQEEKRKLQDQAQVFHQQIAQLSESSSTQLEELQRNIQDQAQVFEQQIAQVTSETVEQINRKDQVIKDLERKNAHFEQEKQVSVKDHQQVEQLQHDNAQLRKDVEFAQREAIKARTRAEGLEKMCEAYKAQLEEVLKASENHA